MGPGRDSEGRFLKRTIRWVKHKPCFTKYADPAQAEQAGHMCYLDRAETTDVTGLAAKDSRQREGDEPVKEEQKSWLRSLVGVLGYLATDGPVVQYPVKNAMREITRATCGTLARTRRCCAVP